MPAPGGCLCPQADPVTGTPGWKVITSPRQLAVAVAAAYRGTACRHEEGTWEARIPQPSLSVLAVSADASTLRCRLGAAPELGIFGVAFAAWPVTAPPEIPLAELPLPGRLSVRDVRVTTRMGRTVRYLIPEFTVS